MTDNQRSGDFKSCVEEKGNWTTVYEHYGEYQREGGFDGTTLIMQAYPEATIIHNANTAMAMGSVEAQVAAWARRKTSSRPVGAAPALSWMRFAAAHAGRNANAHG